MYRVKNNRWKYLAALLLAIVVLTAGCGKAASAPAAEQASEDMTEAARTADTVAEEAAEEEEKITPENALVGLCFARSETGDNEYLYHAMQDELVLHGFTAANIAAQDLTGRAGRQQHCFAWSLFLRTQDLTGRAGRQQEEIDECLDLGCSLLIVAAVNDGDIPEITDKVTAAEAGVVFVNCTPDSEEILRWSEQDLNAVWIGSTYDQQLAIQMKLLYDYSGTDRGLDFNEDGHVGALLIGGGEEARRALEVTVRDLGSELQILGETESSDPEEISAYTQEILNTHKKEAELVLCSSESNALAASDGVQLRHRLVGRDILVIGLGTHEDTCTAIINKLMSGSTFVDFYEQAKLTAVAAKDVVEGNQAQKTIADVIFKVTEDNAQEVLDQLWKTRSEIAGEDSTGGEEAAEPEEDADDKEQTDAEEEADSEKDADSEEETGAEE